MEDFIALKEEDITGHVHIIQNDALPDTLTSNPVFQALQNQVKPPYKEERRLTVSIRTGGFNTQPEDIANWLLTQKVLKGSALFGIAERISCNTKEGLMSVTFTEEMREIITRTPQERRFTIRQFRDKK